MGKLETCGLCGKRKMRKRSGNAGIDVHHINYEPEVVIRICRPCHSLAHNIEKGMIFDEANKKYPLMQLYNRIKREKLSSFQINESDIKSHVPKGSPLITFRLPNEDVYTLQERAKIKGKTFSAYIRDCLEYIMRHNLDAVQQNQSFSEPTLVKANGCSVDTLAFISPKELRLPMAKRVLAQAETKVGVKRPYDPETMNRTMDLPVYNSAIHKVGDKVRVKRGKRWTAIVVPSLDADGNPYA